MRRFTPMPLRRMQEPFDHSDWLYELKYDGFRALAFVGRNGVELVSRNGNPFRQFAGLNVVVREAVLPTTTVLDGEIVCLDEAGHAQFETLLFRRGTPCFVAFDVLAVGRRESDAWGGRVLKDCAKTEQGQLVSF